MNDEREAEAEQAASRLQHLAANPILSDQEAADLKAVLHALRCYRFERDGERDTVRRVLENWRRTEADNKAALQRARGLLNYRRKTVAMDALREALQPSRVAADGAEAQSDGSAA